MRSIPAAFLLVLIVTSNAVFGAEPFVWGQGPSVQKPTGAAGGADEKQKVAEMAAMLADGKYDEVQKAAVAFLHGAKGDEYKTEGLRLVAEATRKKGDWKAAPAAYLKLRERYEKSSDEYARNDAIAEVLRVSPTGVYPPMAAAAAAAVAGGVSKTLADDPTLAEALQHVAEGRAEKLKGRIAAVKRARSPQEVIALYEPLAVEFGQLRAIAPGLPADAEQQAARAAGARLAELGKQTTAGLAARQAEFQQAATNRRLTSSQKRDMGKYQNLCNELAKVEESFQGTLAKVGGTADAAAVRAESVDRQQNYSRLAPQFAVPADTDMGWGTWTNWW